MKWRKLGQVFDAKGAFAQSPQALVSNDMGFVRVYYSTRTTDASGKFLSNVAWVDMNSSLDKVIARSEKEVIALGDRGCFDEHGIFPFSVERTENSIVAYITGWSRRTSVSVETAVGLVESFDAGRTFTRHGNGPVFTSSLNEPFLVGDAFVRNFEGNDHMWYIYGTKWINGDQAERVYKIGHAKYLGSWRRDGKQIISNVLGADECQALPTVIKIGDIYHMYFCYRHATDFRTNKERGYRLGYAFSYDLEKWTRDDAVGGMGLSPTGWDSEMMCYPHLFKVKNDIYMLYNGNEFGKHGFGLALLESAS